jgi:hypothetical protein
VTRGTRTTAQHESHLLLPFVARRHVAWRRAVFVAVVVVALLLAAAATFLGRFASDRNVSLRNVSLRNDEATTLVSARWGASAAVSAVRSAAGRLTVDTRLADRHYRQSTAVTWYAALLVLGGVVEVLLDRTTIASNRRRPSLLAGRGPPLERAHPAKSLRSR